MRLVGSTSGRQFALGDAVKVRIENVSVPRRKIDLALVEHAATAPPLAERPRGRHGRDDRRKPLRPAPSRKHDKSRPGRGGPARGGGSPRGGGFSRGGGKPGGGSPRGGGKPGGGSSRGGGKPGGGSPRGGGKPGGGKRGPGR